MPPERLDQANEHLRGGCKQYLESHRSLISRPCVSSARFICSGPAAQVSTRLPSALAIQKAQSCETCFDVVWVLVSKRSGDRHEHYFGVRWPATALSQLVFDHHLKESGGRPLFQRHLLLKFVCVFCQRLSVFDYFHSS